MYDGKTRLHYNRFRYYDPSIGRYISADPIGPFGGPNLYTYASGNPLGLIDFYGLIEGSASNTRKRRAVAAWAAARSGSTDFSKDSYVSSQSPAGSNKCSAFTCAAAASAGADTTVTVPGDTGGNVTRCPTAAELAQGDVPGWRLLNPGEDPEPGDIAAARIPGGDEGATGHAAVVTEDSTGGTTTVGAHSWGVGPPGADGFASPPRHRRFTGE